MSILMHNYRHWLWEPQDTPEISTFIRIFASQKKRYLKSLDNLILTKHMAGTVFTPPSNDSTETLPRRGDVMTRQENLFPLKIRLS